MLEFLNHWDTKIFLALNGIHNALFDFIMYWVSVKWIWIPLYLLLLVFLIKKYKKQVWLILIAVALLITLSDQISSGLLKEWAQRYRPCHDPSLTGLVHLVNDQCGGKYGFVSSHASNSFALAVLIIMLLKDKHPKLKWVLFFWALLVSYSRIYLGVHYPGDVIGGMILGIIWAFLVYSLYKYIRIKYMKGSGQT